ncbi:MAG: ATP-dependent DNA helicase PcrA [Candidatus Hydrogenedentota bacterium]|nr:MAG: ATP-dependent DNA helicase PcrA [Candidatus Hydrogenedentota bacterium]
MDFSDLLYQTVRILKQNPEALESLQNRYEYFMVDEYQDTNYAQYALVQMLAEKSRNLCVVGDDDQAIYGWRGANVENILNFQKDFPDAHIVKLEQNYRSTQKILNISNEVIQNNLERMPKELWTEKKEGPIPKLLVFPSEYEEAAGIANIISSLKGIIPLKEIAVLYRTNFQSRIIEEKLLARDIPYRVYGGVSFYQRKEIKDILAYLTLLVNPKDEAALARALSTPSKGIGEKSLAKLLEAGTERIPKGEDYLIILLNNSPLSGKAAKSGEWFANCMLKLREKVNQSVDFALLLEELLDETNLREMYEEEDKLTGTSRLENIADFKDSLLLFQSENPKASLADFLQSISLYTSSRPDLHQEDCVQLMTIHNAKGLEFDVVFICSLNEEILPHYLSLRDGNLEEERRLFYVAVTRARERLYLCRTMQRMRSGQAMPSFESSFLYEISESHYEEQIYHNVDYSYSSSFSPPPSTRFKRQKSRTLPSEADTTPQWKTSLSDASFQPQDVVMHPRYGQGTVIRIEGSGQSEKAYIRFADGKTRKFLVAFAGLKKV